jgi:phosphotransferase system enzyme I (PtsI)
VADLLFGTGVGSGATAGPVARVADPSALPADLPAPQDLAAEVALATDALESVARDLEKMAGVVAGEAADILRSQAALARDPALADRVAAAALAA